MKLEITANEFGSVNVHWVGIGTGSCHPSRAAQQIEDDARETLIHAHVEVERVTVSERTPTK